MVMHTRHKSLSFDPTSHTVSSSPIPRRDSGSVSTPLSTSNEPPRKRLKRSSPLSFAPSEMNTPPTSPPFSGPATDAPIANQDPVIREVLATLKANGNKPMCAKDLCDAMLKRGLNMNSNIVSTKVAGYMRKQERGTGETVLGRYSEAGFPRRTFFYLLNGAFNGGLPTPAAEHDNEELVIIDDVSDIGDDNSMHEASDDEGSSQDEDDTTPSHLQGPFSSKNVGYRALSPSPDPFFPETDLGAPSSQRWTFQALTPPRESSRDGSRRFGKTEDEELEQLVARKVGRLEMGGIESPCRRMLPSVNQNEEESGEGLENGIVGGDNVEKLTLTGLDDTSMKSWSEDSQMDAVRSPEDIGVGELDNWF